VRGLAAITALLRRARAEPGVLATLFGLVTITALVVALSPRLFERVADEGLRYDVGRATSQQRDLQVTLTDSIRAGTDDPLEFVRARGENHVDRFPRSVRDVIDASDFVIETPRFGLVDPPNYTTFVTLRYQDRVEDRLRIEEGRLPAPLAQSADPMAPGRFEVAISSETARATSLRVGDVLPAILDSSDPLIRLVFPRPTGTVELHVVGRFSVLDPADPAWFDDLTYARPGIGGSEEAPIAFTSALFAPAAYGDVEGLGLPTRNRWRYHVDASRLDAGQLESLVPDLRRLDTSFSPSAAPGGVLYRSGLPDIIAGYLRQRASTEAVLSVAAIGPLAVAAGALALVAAIVIRRRRMTLALARGRGASSRQLLLAQLWEGLLVTVPAAVVGLVVARFAVPARADLVSAVGAVIVALAVTALLVLATWPRARRARREIERDDLPARRLSPRRLVFEVTTVVAASGAAWLLRERGLGSARSSDALTGFDPFVAAAPVLIGLATALLTLRLYPIPVRGLAWLSARRRDLVPALGLRSIGRDRASATLPLLVVTVTVAIGVFSSVLALTIDRGQVLASWQEVGADYRAESPAGTDFTLDIDPSSAAGVEAVAPALVAPASFVTGDTRRGATATLVAIEPAAQAVVLAGTPVVLPSPAAFAGAPDGPDAGSPERPIPVVISRRLPNDWPALAAGDAFTIGVRDQVLDATVTAIADALPGVPRGAPFIVAPLGSVAAGWDGPALRPNTFFARAPESAAAALQSAAGPSAEVTSRHTILAAQRDAPLVAAIGRGFGIALIAAGLYAGLAIIAVIVLDAQRRARELAYLRTLGLSGRQSVSLTFVEHAPPTALALGIGVVLGLAVAWLTEPGLGLDAYIGRAVPVRLQVDWVAVLVIAGTVVGVIVLMVAASSWLARRLEPAEALRIGDA
jgi:putative ABC transport system permease protein